MSLNQLLNDNDYVKYRYFNNFDKTNAGRIATDRKITITSKKWDKIQNIILKKLPDRVKLKRNLLCIKWVSLFNT